MEENEQDIDQLPTEQEEVTENDNSENVAEENETIETEKPETDLTVDDYKALKAEKERLAAEKAELERKNKQLFERAKKAQGEKPLTNKSELSADEIRLIAKGVSDEDISILKRLQAGAKAMGENVSLSKLYDEDPAFVALKEKREKEERSKKAALGGSGRAISNSEPEVKSGMSDEEHKAVWEKKMKEMGVM